MGSLKMALFDLFKPKWQSSNPEARISAIHEMDEHEDLNRLKTMAIEDSDPKVCAAALKRIDSLPDLEEIYSKAGNNDVRTAARQMINVIFCDVIIGSTADDRQACSFLEKLDDPDLLSRIAVEAASPAMRIKAIEKISSQEMLCRIVEQECGKEPARAALEKITDEPLLERISKTGGSRVVRRAAEEKLEAIVAERTKPSKEEALRRNLEEIVASALDLSKSRDWDDAEIEFEKLDSKWLALDPDAAHGLRADFDAAKNQFNAQQQDFLKREAQMRGQGEARNKLISAAEKICSDAEGLAGSPTVDSEAQINELKAKWEDLAGALDGEQTLLDRFEKACSQAEAVAPKVNQEKKIISEMDGLCSRAEKAAELGDLDEAERVVKDLREKLNSTKLEFMDSAAIEQRSRAVMEKAKELKAAAKRQDEEQKRAEDLQKAEKICIEIEGLVEADDRAGADKRAKQLQSDWDSLNSLRGEDRKTFESRYIAALNKFNERQQEFHEKQDWERWHNKTRKEELCAAVEALDNEAELSAVFEKLKEYQKNWKEIGPVPGREREALWQRFREACDRNFERCKPFFDEQNRKMEESLAKKEELCQNAEEHAESVMWKASADILKQLQTEWKEAGPCRRSDEEKLYARFRKACDAFFDRRAEHFKELDKEREQNQVKKEELCAKAEALTENMDWTLSSSFRNLQAKWKEIGPAPRKTEQELWERFRAAADSFYSWLDEQREQYLAEKEKLCEEAEAVATAALEDDANNDSDMKTAVEKIMELQAKWKETGPAQKEKSDEVWARFRSACDKVFESRREQLEESEKERQANEEKKRDLLDRAEELAQSEDQKAAADGLKALQEEWKAVGPAPRHAERELWSNFQEICDNFFAGRRQYFEEMNERRLENLKKKEALCVRLQSLVGADSQAIEGAGETQAIDLAEKIKLAMESNFALAGIQDDEAGKKDEVRSIQKEWKTIGPVPREHSDIVWKRYRGLLDLYYSAKPGENAVSRKTEG